MIAPFALSLFLIQSPAPSSAQSAPPQAAGHGEIAIKLPVGRYGSLPPHLRFAGSRVGPHGDPAASRIPGCAFQERAPNRPGPTLNCQICGGETDIRDLDFTLRGSIWLYINIPTTCPSSTVTRLVVANDRFGGGPTVNLPNGDLVHIFAIGHILDRVFVDDTFDGRYSTGLPGTMEALRINARDGNETWLRDAFINIPGRPVSDAFGQQASPGHNRFLADSLYLSGMTLAATGDHGELFEFGKSRPGAVPVEMTYRHNVLVATTAPASNTALLWLGSGDHSGPLKIDTVALDGNILIVEPRTTSRVVGIATANVARLIVTHNAIWAHGSYFCIIDEERGVANATFRDNVNLFDGSPINGFDAHSGACPGTRH
jgi:hypothetical protein